MTFGGLRPVAGPTLLLNGETIPVLIKALRHEDVWGSSGINPRILNPTNGWN
jgi:hypothetical protein